MPHEINKNAMAAQPPPQLVRSVQPTRVVLAKAVDEENALGGDGATADAPRWRRQRDVERVDQVLQRERPAEALPVAKYLERVVWVVHLGRESRI